jgi:hypothetical protein
MEISRSFNLAEIQLKHKMKAINSWVTHGLYDALVVSFLGGVDSEHG